MERDGLWRLFWATGLPAAWLLSRLTGKPEAEAALNRKEPKQI